MRSRAIGVLPWVILALDAALIAIALVLQASMPTPVGDVALTVASVTVFGVVGGLVASRRPRNPIGWIFCVSALTGALQAVAATYADRWLAGQGGSLGLAETAAWYSNGAWIPGVMVPVTFLLLLFPDGRLLSPRWRPVAWAAAAGIAGLYVLDGLSPGPLDDFRQFDNPYGVNSPVLDVLTPVFVLLPVIGIVASPVSLILRRQRAGPREREQIRWLGYAGCLAATTLLAGTASYDVLGADLANAIILLSVLLLPVATGIAILRHRLYDIDVVINRTLVYGALSATLALVYLGGVLLLGLVLRPVVEGSNLAIAGSTLAVAGLFRPARARIQAGVDRRFYRRKYDAARTLESFGARLRDEVELDVLRRELRDVVTETVQPAHVGLWLREDGP